MAPPPFTAIHTTSVVSGRAESRSVAFPFPLQTPTGLSQTREQTEINVCSRGVRRVHSDDLAIVPNWLFKDGALGHSVHSSKYLY
jgi:hypothetical protein